MQLLLRKSHIKEHERVLASGTVEEVRAHEDKRTKKEDEPTSQTDHAQTHPSGKLTGFGRIMPGHENYSKRQAGSVLKTLKGQENGQMAKTDAQFMKMLTDNIASLEARIAQLERTVAEQKKPEPKKQEAEKKKVIGTDKIKEDAKKMDSNAFLFKYNVQGMVGGAYPNKDPEAQYHDEVNPKTLDPSEWDDWNDMVNGDQYHHHAKKTYKEHIKDRANSIKNGEDAGSILVEGDIHDRSSRPMVIDGHHRTAALILAGMKAKIQYNTDTLAEMWLKANGEKATRSRIDQTVNNFGSWMIKTGKGTKA